MVKVKHWFEGLSFSQDGKTVFNMKSKAKWESCVSSIHLVLEFYHIIPGLDREIVLTEKFRYCVKLTPLKAGAWREKWS